MNEIDQQKINSLRLCLVFSLYTILQYFIMLNLNKQMRDTFFTTHVTVNVLLRALFLSNKYSDRGQNVSFLLRGAFVVRERQSHWDPMTRRAMYRFM